jgi:hypothetical protein
VQPNNINRFSFRLAGELGPWKKHDKQPLQELESGNQVNIYCHSLGVGPYANIENPPTLAVPIRYSAEERKLAVFVPEEYAKNKGVRSIVEQYDCGTLAPEDRDAFEEKGYLNSTDRIKKIKRIKHRETSYSIRVSTDTDTDGPFVSVGLGHGSSKNSIGLWAGIGVEAGTGVEAARAVGAGTGVVAGIGLADLDVGASFPYSLDKDQPPSRHMTRIRHSKEGVGYGIATFTVLFEAV